jgi:hypothetical protein
MNTKDFIQSLRKVIREEVQIAVRTELKQFTSVIQESKSTFTQKAPVQVKTNKPSYVKQQKPQYSNNPMLNEILGKTSGFSGQGPMAYLEENVNYNDFAEWPTMNARPSIMPSVVTDINGSQVNMKKLAETEAGAAVVDALTKDYSALMKAIDKKKGK